MENVPLTVSDCVALINQTLEYAYPSLLVEGEISSFKVNKDKYVFFDIKDQASTLSCFMMVYQLRMPLEDGMRVQLVASPKLTQWGRFSLTVREVRPLGEGSLKRSFELLKAKLEKEGLLSPERKRQLPVLPAKIGVISSTGAAGYADFISLLEKRWGGMEIEVANVQVQGADAPRQIVKAIEHFNQTASPPEVLVIIRGGGSADDLSAFNDEPLARAIAASRIPTLVGVGHEVDVSLADMVCDKRAATPSNAAELLVPDRREIISGLKASVKHMLSSMSHQIEVIEQRVTKRQNSMYQSVLDSYQALDRRVHQNLAVLKQLDPKSALKRGYAIVRLTNGRLAREAPALGDTINVETTRYNLKAGVTYVEKTTKS